MEERREREDEGRTNKKMTGGVCLSYAECWLI